MATAQPVITDDDLPGDPPAPSPRPAPSPPVAPEPPPKKHQHSSRLTKLALEMGYTQADLDDHPSEAIWEDIERVRAVEVPRPAAAVAPTPPTPEPPADPDEAYLSELEKVEPHLARLQRQARKDLQEVRAQLKAKDEVLETLTKAEQQRQSRAVTRMVDLAFAALPEKFHELVGVGAIEELTDPGQKGWRGAIYQAAKIAATDGTRAIAQKILAAATAVCGDRVKETPTDPYGRLPATPPRPVPPKDPVNGRFTAEQFEQGQIHRPNGRQTGHDQLSAVEATRRYLKEIGDPRGDRPVVEFDEDLPA